MCENDSMQAQNNEAKKQSVWDELDKMYIEQLHKATLQFSAQSLETKKLCVTILTAVYAVIATMYNSKQVPLHTLFIFLGGFGFVVSIMFAIVDSIMYYFQDKLRYKMHMRTNRIKDRYAIVTESSRRTDKGRFGRSLKSGSNFIYWGLCFVLGILPFCVGMYLKFRK